MKALSVVFWMPGTLRPTSVVLGVGMKTLSNHTNHMALTPVDKAFQQSVDA